MHYGVGFCFCNLFFRFVCFRRFRLSSVLSFVLKHLFTGFLLTVVEDGAYLIVSFVFVIFVKRNNGKQKMGCMFLANRNRIG